MTNTLDRDRKRVHRKMQASFEKYDWTQKQQERFEVFVNERFANNPRPTNTLLTHLTFLNQVVERIKKPFLDMTPDDLLPIVQEWQKNSQAMAYGWRCKLKEFLRWESGDKEDLRAERICEDCPQGQLYRSRGSIKISKSKGK